MAKHGGPGGVRTLDLMTASHARSQLRHRPTLHSQATLFVTCSRATVNSLPRTGRIACCEDLPFYAASWGQRLGYLKAMT
jgi:hypothetical protein